jgi:NADH-quinone oxidoreductase subunit J
MTDILFLLASAVALTSALLAVTRRNPVYAAAWMMAALFALAGIFVQLSATFLGTVQILLYAGAIVVLFVFVIMLLNQSRAEIEAERPPRSQRLVAAGAAAALFLAVGGRTLINLEGASLKPPAPLPAAATGAAAPPPVLTAKPTDAPPEAGVEFGSVPYFGRVIYDRHLVAFELISVLVLAAIAAVIAIAKRDLDGESRRRGGGGAARRESGDDGEASGAYAREPAAPAAAAHDLEEAHR